MSDTNNIRLGVCNIFFDGNDLGYTKGGVEVDVTTNTHPVKADQFGESTINEYIMERNVVAKIPLAETTLRNMVNIMPGATLIETGGAAATGSITVTQPDDGETIVVNGVVITFKEFDADAKKDEVAIGITANDTATNLRAFLNTSYRKELICATYAGADATISITYKTKGVEGNNFTLGAGSSGMTISGVALTGGLDPTAARVDVTNAVGTNLLSIAKELRLRPVENGNDPKDDFIIHKAATAGALNFAYKHDQERIYNAEFKGYPDPITKKLYSVGDPAAA